MKRIVYFIKHLTETKKEYILAKQILRCGTSVGANIEEGIGAQSKKDFFTKITISYKECRETAYWLRLLHDTDYLTDKEYNSLIVDCEELIKILGKIQKTLKNQLFS